MHRQSFDGSSPPLALSPGSVLSPNSASSQHSVTSPLGSVSPGDRRRLPPLPSLDPGSPNHKLNHSAAHMMHIADSKFGVTKEEDICKLDVKQSQALCAQLFGFVQELARGRVESSRSHADSASASPHHFTGRRSSVSPRDLVLDNSLLSTSGTPQTAPVPGPVPAAATTSPVVCGALRSPKSRSHSGVGGSLPPLELGPETNYTDPAGLALPWSSARRGTMTPQDAPARSTSSLHDSFNHPHVTMHTPPTTNVHPPGKSPEFAYRRNSTTPIGGGGDPNRSRSSSQAGSIVPAPPAVLEGIKSPHTHSAGNAPEPRFDTGAARVGAASVTQAPLKPPPEPRPRSQSAREPGKEDSVEPCQESIITFAAGTTSPTTIVDSPELSSLDASRPGSAAVLPPPPTAAAVSQDSAAATNGRKAFERPSLDTSENGMAAAPEGSRPSSGAPHGVGRLSSAHSFQRAPAVVTPRAMIGQDAEGFKTINNYIILTELGRGAYGKVKLAMENEKEDQVAIKIVKKKALKDFHRSDSQESKDRFNIEVAIMKKLRHQNIIALYEVIDDPEKAKLYMVMQYAKDGAIISLNEDGTCDKLGLADVRKYSRQLAAGLQYLHNHNVIHRDIKPDNILRDDDTVFWADFGVSEMLDLTEPGVATAHGTPAFQSPEVLNGENCSPAGDVWALGVTIYSMLFGKLPFYGADYLAMRRSVLNDPLVIPDDFMFPEVIKGLLDKDPVTRWSLTTFREHKFIRGAKMDKRRATMIGQASNPLTAGLLSPTTESMEMSCIGNNSVLGPPAFLMGATSQDMVLSKEEIQSAVTQRTASFKHLSEGSLRCIRRRLGLPVPQHEWEQWPEVHSQGSQSQHSLEPGSRPMSAASPSKSNARKSKPLMFQTQPTNSTASVGDLSKREGTDDGVPDTSSSDGEWTSMNDIRNVTSESQFQT